MALISPAELKKSHALLYKPFSYFGDFDDQAGAPGISNLKGISRLIKTGRYDLAKEKAAELIEQSLAGIRYIDTYVTCST